MKINRNRLFFVVFACAAITAGCNFNFNKPEAQMETATAPVFSPEAGTYTAAQFVSLSSDTEGANIYYTLNGSAPTTNSSLYAEPIIINNTTTLKAISVKTTMKNSDVVSAVYTIDNSLWETVAVPQADLAEGTYPSARTVTLSCATEGAGIYYTLNGSTPTTGSSLYSGAVTISNTCTLKAIAAKVNMKNSAVLSVAYAINQGTVAQPAASPAGGSYSSVQNVTLLCATPGAAIYYTLSGDEPDTGSALYTTPIAVNESMTIKAIAVKAGMNNSAVTEAAYKIAFNGNFGGVTGKLVTGETIIIEIDNYTDPVLGYGYYGMEPKRLEFPAMGSFGSGYQGFKAVVSGKAVTVNLSAPSAVEMSLAYISWLRTVLFRAGAASVSAVEKTSNFTLMFDGRLWYDGYEYAPRLNYEDYSGVATLWDSYPKNAETEIMSGISICTHPESGNYALKYNRPITVKRLYWEYLVAVYDDDGNQIYENGTWKTYPMYHGFGIMPGNSGSLSSYTGSWETPNNRDTGTFIIMGRTSWDPAVVTDFSLYESHLKELNLHPSQGIRIDHSNISVTGISGSTNVMENGIYDFVLAYYNPAPTGASQTDETNKALLPRWGFSSKLTLDGYARDSGGYIMNGGKYTPALPDGITSRSIGGITATSGERKASFAGVYSSVVGGYSGEAYQKDEPRVDFIGSITYAMAKYMNEKFGINEFSNTNIIGDWSVWNGYKFYNNVALMGDYSSSPGIPMETRGVIDIKGSLPPQIMDNDTESRYLNIWSNVSRETNILNFPVVVIRGSGGEFITTGSPLAPGVESKAIIYHNKYTSAPPNNGGVQPNHRAFVVNGTPKITGGSIPSSNASWYQGTKPANPIPSLDESAWIEYANGGTLPANLAANYTGLSSEYKMTQGEWDGL